MKNTLADLNNHLFAALERLNDESLDDEGVKKEIQRAGAVSSLASSIVANAKIQLDACKFASDMGQKAEAPSLFLEKKNVK